MRVRDCWDGARSVRAAEFGRGVVGFLRPRSLGFSRTRAPISLQLYRAAGDGRLVWRGPDSFAMLQRPADRRAKGSGWALRWVDRHWFVVVMLGEFALLVGSVLVLVALRRAVGQVAVLYGAYLAEIVFLAVIVADQITGLLKMVWRGVRSLLRGTPRTDQVAAETLPFEQWVMALCHHVPEGGASALLDDVGRRLTTLAGSDAALACPRDGITTDDMRARVAVWADGLQTGHENPEVNVRLPRRLPAVAHRIGETGAFFFVYCGLVLFALASLASVVAGWERSTCGASCANRPATFARALEWIGYRLVWRDAPGLAAETFYSGVMGVLVGVFVPLTVLMAVGSLLHYRRYRAALRTDYQTAMKDAFRRDRVLLLVATQVEREAVLQRAGGYRDLSGRHPVYRLGVIGGAEVLLAQTGPGVTSPVSAAYSVPALIDEWQPRYVILLGICFGLREEEQRLGDLIVARQLRVINVRVGETEIRDRGDAVTASHRLVERFTVAEPPPGVRVWQGVLLSWDVLVDSARMRAALKARYRDALGGEMEAAGVYAACVRADVEWIVVKGICDWGQDKTPEAQGPAAANAATFVLDLIEAGAFAHQPLD